MTRLAKEGGLSEGWASKGFEEGVEKRKRGGKREKREKRLLKCSIQERQLGRSGENWGGGIEREERKRRGKRKERLKNK